MTILFKDVTNSSYISMVDYSFSWPLNDVPTIELMVPRDVVDVCGTDGSKLALGNMVLVGTGSATITDGFFQAIVDSITVRGALARVNCTGFTSLFGTTRVTNSDVGSLFGGTVQLYLTNLIDHMSDATRPIVLDYKYGSTLTVGSLVVDSTARELLDTLAAYENGNWYEGYNDTTSHSELVYGVGTDFGTTATLEDNLVVREARRDSKKIVNNLILRGEPIDTKIIDQSTYTGGAAGTPAVLDVNVGADDYMIPSKVIFGDISLSYMTDTGNENTRVTLVGTTKDEYDNDGTKNRYYLNDARDKVYFELDNHSASATYYLSYLARSVEKITASDESSVLKYGKHEMVVNNLNFSDRADMKNVAESYIKRYAHPNRISMGTVDTIYQSVIVPGAYVAVRAPRYLVNIDYITVRRITGSRGAPMTYVLGEAFLSFDDWIKITTMMQNSLYEHRFEPGDIQEEKTISLYPAIFVPWGVTVQKYPGPTTIMRIGDNRCC